MKAWPGGPRIPSRTTDTNLDCVFVKPFFGCRKWQTNTVVSYQNESFSSKWELPCLPPSSLELWRRERASRQLSFWWKTLILIGHYGRIESFLETGPDYLFSIHRPQRVFSWRSQTTGLEGSDVCGSAARLLTGPPTRKWWTEQEDSLHSYLFEKIKNHTKPHQCVIFISSKLGQTVFYWIVSIFLDVDLSKTIFFGVRPLWFLHHIASSKNCINRPASLL